MEANHLNKRSIPTFACPLPEDMAFMFLQHQPLGTIVRVRHNNDGEDTCYRLVEKARTVPQLEKVSDPEPELKRHHEIIPNRLPSNECLLAIEKISKNNALQRTMKYTENITEARHFDKREQAEESVMLYEAFSKDSPRYRTARVEKVYTDQGGFVVQILEQSSPSVFLPLGYLTK